MPWAPTQSLQKGIDGLIRMYQHLPDGTIKSFIDEHCQFLLSPLEGSTPILKESLLIDNLNTDPNTVVLGNTLSKSYTNALKGKSGVYVFFETHETGPSQYGSCIDFNSRLELHYHDCRGSQPKPFYEYARSNGGMSVFS